MSKPKKTHGSKRYGDLTLFDRVAKRYEEKKESKEPDAPNPKRKAAKQQEPEITEPPSRKSRRSK